MTPTTLAEKECHGPLADWPRGENSNLGIGDDASFVTRRCLHAGQGPSKPVRLMAYTYAELKALWLKYGGSAASADTAAAVALAESGGVATASGTNTDGSVDRGLWQINSVHGGLSTFDVAANTKAAIKISNNGTNWNPWVAFKSGSYKKFLSPTTAAGNVPADTTAAGIGIPGIGGISISGVTSGIINTVLKMLGLGSMKDLFERLGLIILGFALVMLGIHLLSSGGGGQAFNVQTETTEAGTTRKIKTPVSQSKTTTALKTGATGAVEAAAVA